MAVPTSHRDTFARDHLPPPEAQPAFINLDRLAIPERLNCAAWLLDAAVADGHGERPAIRSPAGDWTYAGLQQQVNRIAAMLAQDLGVLPGERVLLRAPNNPMLAACWLAVQKCGAIAVATMPLLRAKELGYIVGKAAVRVALCDTRLLGELEAATPRPPIVLGFGEGGDFERMAAAKPPEFQAVATAADDICIIAFTSGTTGQPKATMHCHRDVVAICETFCRQVLRPRPDDLFVGSPPLAFTFGLGSLLLFPLHARAATLLVEEVAPDKLVLAIERYRPTLLATSPTAYRRMLGAERAALASLRTCLSAGETLPRATSDDWHAHTGIRILDGIGSTEMLHIFIAAPVEAIRPGATGTVVPGYEAKVVGDDGRPLPPGAVGRLAVRGPTGCRYLADPRQRDYVVDGWNYTGDAYETDADGYFWFRARSDDMIVSAGYNIGPVEVEDALLTHPAVAECAVIGVPDAERGQIVKAFVVPRPGYAAAGEELGRELQQYVKAAIAPYKYPRAVEFLGELPKTETGKVQRFRLRNR